MRISFFGHYSIYTNWVLNLLVRKLKGVRIQRAYFSGCESIHGALSPKKTFRNSQTAGYVMLKTIEQSLWLKHLFPLIDRASAGGFLSFDALSQAYDIELVAAGSPNTEQVLKLIREDGADLFLSVRYAGLFREKALSIPKIGTINLHSSILPDYKGLENTMQAILHGEKEIGCSLHWIHDPYPKIDTGPVIEQSRVDVDHSKSLFWNCLQLYPLGAELIMDTVKNLKAGRLNSCLTCQPELGKYFSYPTDQDYEQLEKMGMPVFDLKDINQLVQQYYDSGFQHKTLLQIMDRYYPELINTIAWNN